MLNNPTIDKLQAMKFTGMLKGYMEQCGDPDCEALSFEERFGLLVDREAIERDSRRMQSRLRKAKLRLTAAIEDIDYRHPRGLDKRLMMALASGDWIRRHHNCILTGPTGAGKTYIACALGHKACREGFSVLYHRAPRLFQDIARAKGDGRYPRLMNALAKADLLILDDWGTARLTDEQRRDLFELVEDRYERRSTLIAAQLPLDNWHDIIGDPTLADAILDRLIHNAHKIALKGDSMRRKKSDLNKPENND
jgi:DNA replication protein DnaC